VIFADATPSDGHNSSDCHRSREQCGNSSALHGTPFTLAAKRPVPEAFSVEDIPTRDQGEQRAGRPDGTSTRKARDPVVIGASRLLLLTQGVALDPP